MGDSIRYRQGARVLGAVATVLALALAPLANAIAAVKPGILVSSLGDS